MYCHIGCEHCGCVANRLDVPAVVTAAGIGYRCAECGREMRSMTLARALELFREREEAMAWRLDAAARGPRRAIA